MSFVAFYADRTNDGSLAGIGLRTTAFYAAAADFVTRQRCEAAAGLRNTAFYAAAALQRGLRTTAAPLPSDFVSTA
jgi:hypothetical protein